LFPYTTLFRSRRRDRLLAARLVALQRQRQAQVRQGQRGQRLVPVVVVHGAQRAERRAVDPRQHVTRVRLVGEAQVVAILLAVELLAAREQVLAKALERLLQYLFGHVEAALARIEQELDDVRGQRRID